MPLSVRCFTGGAFSENAWLAWDEETGEAAVIDPGAAWPALLEAVRREGVTVTSILLTHAHLDHVEGVAPLVEATAAPVFLHPEAEPFYRSVAAQAAAFGVRMPDPPPPSGWMRGGEARSIGRIPVEVRDAPGHAPGHVILHVPSAGLAFVGDVIFQGSIGRTDLPGGAFPLLMDSITRAVLTLPEETRLLPGHGPETTVEAERRGNPWLAGLTGGIDG